MSSSSANVLFIVFYLVIFLFATSDLKRFIFHVHISRVDRVPVEYDIDSSSTSLALWYPILIGIIFNIFILLFSMVNLIIILCQRNLSSQLFISTFILSLLFTIRFIINITVTKNRNGLSTPTLVERSFFAPSLSLEEELTTITMDWFIKIVGFISTFIMYHRKKQGQSMNIENQHELKLMSDFE
ncbi:unnamed protein product [Adineta steineri]|uniref:Uncharacterized protein n=2 Tax=Adineta steineri TaxID=433720 RepID=A0A814DYH2_9BILA|nr:unnamed protein product [Adineta steineri]